ncbi:NAD(P)/FAD-dependent oxidoreductase [Actinopolymorpha pittospori]|uniref:Thioredoxin reductase n=1 Tax=Actinopolymorpha pittospori TaxID=648752 RepID=A0A927RA13_9ACTN|nr:NAD(P)/FAD-dependent oxidoreductase [Actinopolymorpha pittospori]MBE1607114.1 thioredoxin reductase [Actinopolymorpha pittospori]
MVPGPEPIAPAATKGSAIQMAAEVYDVVVIGGGAAGLSAAVTLGRARRSVVVVDAGEPRNAPAAGVHGFLTRDGMSPADLVRVGRSEVASYGGVLRDGQVVSAERDGTRFTVRTDDGQAVHGRRILVATGLLDELPDVPGLRERWGKDVVHCPYCHGFEVRDRVIGVLGSGPMAMHQVQLFRQWSPRIVLFRNDVVQPSDQEWEELAARGITVVDGVVESVRIEGDAIVGLVLAGGRVIPVDAVAVQPYVSARADFLKGLDLTATTDPQGLGTFVAADERGLTSTPGVWVAGNVADFMAQVVSSAAAGVRTAATINADLVAEEVRLAVAAYRDPFSAASEARHAERLLGDRRHGLDQEQGRSGAGGPGPRA